MSTISLVMIVKDEEKILKRSVDSVRSIIDEFIIVDTGSTDSTKEIIREYSGVDAIEIPFVNYVDTKNEALRKATKDYILLMDADEYVIEGLDKLKAYADKGVDGVCGKIVEGDPPEVITNQYDRMRLWKNSSDYHFVGPGVHEVMTQRGTEVYDSNIKIVHSHKHRQAESYNVRSELYIKILSRYLESHPDDGRATFYMARTYRDMNLPLRAIEWYRKYLSLNTWFKDERWQAAYDSALCWKGLGEYTKARSMIQESKTIDPRRSEGDWLDGIMNYEEQDYKLAICNLETASEKPLPSDVVLFLNPMMYSEQPLEYLSLCYDKTKQYRKGWDVCSRLLKIKEYKPVDTRLVSNASWYFKRMNMTWFFLLGKTPEPVWGGMIEEKGVGGVETTYLELPDCLAARGHNVFVFADCTEPHVYNHVWFIPYGELDKHLCLNPDVVVTSRWYESLNLFPSVPKIAWLQDAYFKEPQLADGKSALTLVDHIICSSLWHRHYIAERFGQRIDGSKIEVIPLGIRKSLFTDPVEKDPYKVVYSSNPDRGLYILKDMWSKITELVSKIRLTITYGWEGLKTWSGDDQWKDKIQRDHDTVMKWVEDAGNINFTGRLTKKALAKEMMSASLVLYPNNFFETFCLTGLEAQASGTPMVTTDMGALSTTLNRESNILIQGDPHSPIYQEKFIHHTHNLLTDSALLNKMIYGCKEYIAKTPCDWSDIAERWENAIYKHR